MIERKELLCVHITASDKNLFTISLVRYAKPYYKPIGTRKLGTGRYALDFRHISVIVECWWIR
jgi:hypothetical protein